MDVSKGWGERNGGGEERQTSQLAISNGDQACGGGAGAVEEGGVLEGAGLLDADVEVVVDVCDL